MSLLIKNGDIVTADDRYKADIYCERETITRIGRNLEVPPDTPVIDAVGKYVFPGFIDPHTHIHLPFKDFCAKDTHATASRAALLGGTTTLIEMCCPERGDEPLDALDIWRGKAEGNSACDYSFHIGVARYDESIERQLRDVVDRGLPSFKIYLAYKGSYALSDEELYHALRRAKELGVIVTAHCENADLVVELQKKLLAEGKTGPEWHYHSRPPFVEAEGTHRLMTFAQATGAHVYVVHLSCGEALRAAMRAKYAGVHAYVEALIQHLTLDKTYAELPDFEGAKYVMSTPLRHKANQDILWNGLRQRFIHTVASDHAPFDFKGQKDRGRDDFTRIPNGLPCLEDRVKLLYTHGVLDGRIDLHTFVDCAATQAARIFGLFPRKGTIQPGSDADLVVFDPNHESVISRDTHSMNIDYSAFEGWPVRGRAETVTVRGALAVRDGKFVGTGGHGIMIEREPTHF